MTISDDGKTDWFLGYLTTPWSNHSQDNSYLITMLKNTEIWSQMACRQGFGRRWSWHIWRYYHGSDNQSVLRVQGTPLPSVCLASNEDSSKTWIYEHILTISC